MKMSFFVGIFVALAQVGCTVELGDETSAEESIASRSERLWSVTNSFWPSGAVNVCFTSATYNDSSLASWRNNVRLWVMDSISRHADVQFYGFDKCSSSAGANWVKVTRTTSDGSNAHYNGYSSSENKISFGNDSNRKAVVLHEFMHKLGFEHEFNRKISNGCAKHQGTDVEADGTAYTDYDQDSITNSTYCNSNDELSPWDVIGLQTVYGRKHTGSIVGQGGQCLNIKGGSTSKGANLIAWPCVGVDNDTWSFKTTGLVQAKLGSTKRCANIKGGVVDPNGSTNLISWSCSTSHENSKFALSGVEWRAMGNMCVTATSTSSGAELEVQECKSSLKSRQSWDFFANSTRIRLNGKNLCVHVPDASAPLGTKLKLSKCSSTTGKQVFSYDDGEILYSSNRCINVKGGDPKPGSKLVLWDGCGYGHPNEYFYASGLIHGLGQCVDELGGQATKGNNVGVYPCVASAPNHRWDYHF